ncbi:hypothetical protein [Dysgonomonas sp. 521]|uniref:hypothetical protein n=1 Tax=Dysgonomonas sp. 521 TaxID=2302932 RepID=UPI0016290F6F|nr:hypothetical protein [Dysgonomonas sp. 521]
MKRNLLYLLLFIGLISFTHCTGSIESRLQTIAKETNKDCPKILDNWTRLDSCVAVGGSDFEYHLTIMQIVIADTTNFKTQLKPQLVQVLKTMPDLKIFRDNDITVKYTYNDADGKYIFSEVIAPQEYK